MLPVSTAFQDQAKYWYILSKSVSYTKAPFVGDKAVLSAVVRLGKVIAQSAQLASSSQLAQLIVIVFENVFVHDRVLFQEKVLSQDNIFDCCLSSS